jgi:hypothetical protein
MAQAYCHLMLRLVIAHHIREWLIRLAQLSTSSADSNVTLLLSRALPMKVNVSVCHYRNRTTRILSGENCGCQFTLSTVSVVVSLG